MKKVLLSSLIFFVFCLFSSCSDKCDENRLVIRQIPIYHPFLPFRNSVVAMPAGEIQDPGKICEKDNYLYINEIKKGVHVIDNNDPSNPRLISFINIPGNGDIIIYGNILYADSYSDLVAIDISDPTRAKEVGRANEVFPVGWFNRVHWNAGSEGLFFGEYKEQQFAEMSKTDCGDNIAIAPSVKSLRSETSIGTFEFPKTMTRFAIQDKYLYAIFSIGNFRVFDLRIPSEPSPGANVEVEPDMFSIFVYKDKLFLGSSNGITVYDDPAPGFPRKIASFPTGTSCDQITIENDIAYVLRRSGTFCTSNLNELHIVDIHDIKTPKRIKAYSLDSPYKAIAKYPYLYIAEGDNGFKVFDVRDNLPIDEHLLSFKKDVTAYDMITTGINNLWVVGKDGLYQYDVSDPANVKELSKIPVKRVSL